MGGGGRPLEVGVGGGIPRNCPLLSSAGPWLRPALQSWLGPPFPQRVPDHSVQPQQQPLPWFCQPCQTSASVARAGKSCSFPLPRGVGGSEGSSG